MLMTKQHSLLVLMSGASKVVTHYDDTSVNGIYYRDWCQWYTITTGVICSSDVSKLVTNTLLLLLQLLGGISKLVTHKCNYCSLGGVSKLSMYTSINNTTTNYYN